MGVIKSDGQQGAQIKHMAVSDKRVQTNTLC